MAFLKITGFDLSQIISEKLISIERDDKIVFLISFLIGILAHGSALVNFFVNEDGHGHLYGSLSSMWASGRWLAGLAYSLTENYPFQFLHMIIFLFFLSISGTIISKLLQVRTLILRIIVTGLLISYPAFAVGISYNFAILIYALSCFFAVYSVFLAYKSIKGVFVGAILLMLSLALYQAYLAISVCLCISIFIILFFNVKSKNEMSHVINKALHFLLYIFLGLFLYLLSLKASKIYYGGEFYNYKGANNVGLSGVSIDNLCKLINDFRAFFFGKYFIFPNYVYYSIIIILSSALFCLISRSLFAKNLQTRVVKILLLSISVFALIVSSFIIRIAAPLADIREMQTYGVPVILSLSLAILSQQKPIVKTISIIFGIVVLLGFVNRSNAIHLQSYLYTQSSFLTANRLFSRIEQVSEFNQNSKIAIVGKLSNLSYTMSRTPPFNEISQGYFGGPVGVSDEIAPNKFVNIIKYMGYDLKYASPNEMEKAKDLTVNMPAYPQIGSIKTFDDLIVVNLGNNNIKNIKHEWLNEGRIRFTMVTSEPNRWEYAWYIYKGSERIKVFWYTENNSIDFEFIQNGEYRALGFIREPNKKEGYSLHSSWISINNNRSQ